MADRRHPLVPKWNIDTARAHEIQNNKGPVTNGYRAFVVFGDIVLLHNNDLLCGYEAACIHRYVVSTRCEVELTCAELDNV